MCQKSSASLTGKEAIYVIGSNVLDHGIIEAVTSQGDWVMIASYYKIFGYKIICQYRWCEFQHIRIVERE